MLTLAALRLPPLSQEFHASVLQQLEEASERTRPKFRDVEFQRAKRRTAAASAGSSRGWYLEVDTWVAGTTAGTADAAEGSGSDAQVGGLEGRHGGAAGGMSALL
jgi:hypothetical protein